jgi:hypothetical protein
MAAVMLFACAEAWFQQQNISDLLYAAVEAGGRNERGYGSQHENDIRKGR